MVRKLIKKNQKEAFKVNSTSSLLNGRIKNWFNDISETCKNENCVEEQRFLAQRFIMQIQSIKYKFGKYEYIKNHLKHYRESNRLSLFDLKNF